MLPASTITRTTGSVPLSRTRILPSAPSALATASTAALTSASSCACVLSVTLMFLRTCGYITQVAVGKLKELGVFGNDYDTHDGTGVRDYIHVVDLALGHVKAIEKLNDNPGIVIYNLGTGNGYSVLDIVKNFEAATGIHIPYVIKARRPGDIATCYCDAGKAERELHWKAERDLKTMCADSWRWQKNNPNGYDD